jgi:hypothetical protein
MANANAIAEKLKDLGLRHGEKLGVAVASGLFFLCVGLAAKKETINTDPDKIKAATKQSESNLNRKEDTAKIIQNLEAMKIKDSNFAKVVDEQVKTALVPSDYQAVREWVSPEPGAGLIRDTPVLIAPSEIYAYPGRGGFLVFALDADGNHIPDDTKEVPKDAPTRRRRRRAAGGMMGGMMGGGMMGGGVRKKKGKSKEQIALEQRQAAELEAKRLKGKLVGGGEVAVTNEEAAEPLEKSKEIQEGHRWVAITGVFDHAQLVANYRTALKNPAVAHPNYARIDLERQTKQPDGSWSGWEAVSSDENLKILDNLPEVEEDELTPETVRPQALVDPLPFLKQGLWEKVHVASLVPKEKKEIKKTEIGQGSYGSMMGGGMMGNRAAMSRGGNSAGYSESMGAMMNRGGGGGRMGRAGGMIGGMGGGMGSEAPSNYWTTTEKRVMIRAFDFTVKPDNSYRYRARIVVHNPNLNREDVAHGVNTKSKTLRGPWCDATDEVHMPPDVMPYAISTEPPSRSSDMKAKFQIIRFRPLDGVTVTKNVTAGPGEEIGEPGSVTIPSSDGTKPKASSIDFNSRQFVLDIIANKKTGGYQHLPAGMIGPPIERPAIALLLRPDGSVAVHTEADDFVNEVRRDIDANYKQEVKESGKKRESSTGMGMGGMMGGMGAMRGGGMGAGMR